MDNTIVSPEVAPTLQASTTSKLLMTKAQYRFNHLNVAGEPFDKIVVGAAIFKSATTLEPHETCKILLLKRSAHEVYYPNVFELPSGNVDDNDASIKHALAREVKEETGVNVSCVIAELPEVLYSTDKQVATADGTTKLVRKTCVQLNFVVEAEGNVISVNPEEHSVGVWASEEDLDRLEMTEGMRSVVKNAMAWKESQAH